MTQSDLNQSDLIQVDPMRYRLRHMTRYVYAHKVELASHILHLTPRGMPGQRVLAADIAVMPTPTRTRRGVDHFGNTVHLLFFDSPHHALEVTATADVTVDLPLAPYAGATPAWEQIRDQAMRNPDTANFLFASPMLTSDAQATSFAAESFSPGTPILAGLLAMTHRIYREFTFSPGATTLQTTIAEVLAGRRGVCQDFTNLMISGLRGLGLPARYVSGYVRNDRIGDDAVHGADHSHAWVACWLGEEHGWIGLDPTNGVMVQNDHVILAWGRDYGDVSPLRGVILGGGAHEPDVQVSLQPIG